MKNNKDEKLTQIFHTLRPWYGYFRKIEMNWTIKQIESKFIRNKTCWNLAHYWCGTTTLKIWPFQSSSRKQMFYWQTMCVSFRYHYLPKKNHPQKCLFEWTHYQDVKIWYQISELLFWVCIIEQGSSVMSSAKYSSTYFIDQIKILILIWLTTYSSLSRSMNNNWAAS